MTDDNKPPDAGAVMAWGVAIVAATILLTLAPALADLGVRDTDSEHRGKALRPASCEPAHQAIRA